MKIATWNVERLRHKKSLDQMILACEKLQADILVLTETDKRLHPDYRFCFESPLIAECQPSLYALTENRISIYTNYPCIREHPTYDKNTALCIELQTELGNLIVYGTIIGIYGNRHPSFPADLKKQMDDIHRLCKIGNGLCVCGDYNCSFSDNYYFTKAGRTALLESFRANQISILTEDCAECIDHIAISKDFVGNASIQVEEWNCDKLLSDHKGIAVTLQKPNQR